VRGLPVGLQPMTVQCREAIDWVVLIGCAPFGGMCLSLSFRLVRSLKHLVAAFCIRDTRGVLNVSTSVVDSEGVDLVFHWRGSTATLAVQIKALLSYARLASEIVDAEYLPDAHRASAGTPVAAPGHF
jgi:hypothetical protein